MNGVGWSSSMVVHDFHDHDGVDSELRGHRHYVPDFILRRFLPSPEDVANNPWMVYDQNQMLAVLSGPESLTLYHTDTREIDFHHFSLTYGGQDIYSAFTESLTQQSTISGQESRKLQILKRVDRDIYHGLMDPVWQIMYNHENRTGMIQLDRSDVYNFRKHLYLLTSLARKGDTMHLLANNERMEDARVRRRKLKDQRGMDHVRDVWLQNSEQILDTPHRDVLKNTNIFDLDREDYRANALERYVVFWEAGPGEEFVLTDSAFGGFEGGEIGAKKNSSVDMTPRELETHLYAKDFMWHQIYVLSPTLAVALCHPTLIHPELTKMQRRRWGLRRSLLEDLPHDLPNKYFKDMKKSEMSFSKDNWHLPAEVEKAFGGKGYEPRRDEDKLVFPVHQLSSQQTALVNSVLLHNQHLGPKIKSVCVRPSSIPSSPYRSIYNALTQFTLNPWSKYSVEQQNDYRPLMDKLEQFLQPMSPQLGPQANYSYQPMFSNHFDPSAAGYALPTEKYLDPAGHIRAHATSNHSSITSSFTPSSQSSYSYSSASSQSSTSTKTTSIDTPRFDPKDLRINKEEQKAARREQKLNGASQRSSEASGKTQRSKSEKSEKPQPAPSLNITIEQTLPIEGTSSSASGGVPIFRGREPEVRYDPPSGKSSKKSSPNPSRAELDTTNRQRYAEPAGHHHMPPPNRTYILPERPSYTEPSRPSLPSRSRTEPQAPPSIPNGHRAPNYGVPNGMEQYMEVPQPQPMQQRRSRSPERHYVPENPQPPRRVNRSPERPAQQQRPQAQRVATAPATWYEPQNVHLDARGRQYEPVQQLDQRSTELRQQPKAQRPIPAYEERAKQVVNSVPDRLHQVINSDLPPLPQLSHRQNRSPERKPEPQRAAPPPRETMNGHVYDIVSGQQSQLPEPQPQMAPAPPAPQQPYLQPNNVPSGMSSRNTSASTEHPVRPGVEIVRGRPRDAPAPQQQSQQQQPPPVPEHQPQTGPPPPKLPPPPVIVEKVVPKPSVPVPEQVPAPPVNPVIKQLRFETPPRTKLNHRSSDTSLAGSMMVEVGDSPGGQNALTRYQQPMSDDDTTSDSGSSDEDDGSWEDEGYTGAVEITKSIPKRHTVRFADKLRSPVRPKVVESPNARRGVEIERPSSRLGRRVEIPRPLSRTGHSRFQQFESRKQKQTGLHQQFATVPSMRRF